MDRLKIQVYIENVLNNIPQDWLRLTTHRLDIYNEALAKTQFLEEFELLFKKDNYDIANLKALPTAFDYIRLGHPLSSILEWTIAKLNNTSAKNIISFSSKTMPILSILRKNLLDHKHTRILYKGELPKNFNVELLRQVYNYKFEIKKLAEIDELDEFNGSTILLINDNSPISFNHSNYIDFYITIHSFFGSIICVNGDKNTSYISEIQHVRRRETIAMTPSDALSLLKVIVSKPFPEPADKKLAETYKTLTKNAINKVTDTDTKPLVASSGLSMQYAIMMGLIHNAIENYKGKKIKFIVPPNCYGGTNDQARRVAACLENVEIIDLPVDGENDMVDSIHIALEEVAKDDAVPYIIAEIPTNPRVEVPNLLELKKVLSAKRKTAKGKDAVAPIFILDQTFCPNTPFLGEGEILSTVKTISYVSGSKFPSGGLCTAGYCVANKKADTLLKQIEKHLQLCDNEATELQYEILAKQMPSMNKRIAEAYNNTREFVNYIQETLPEAKINFVSEKLAKEGFTPSVFSLDLPTKGSTGTERETYKRALNLKLINLMINEIPDESKFCVSYGQLKGCYWTIPATSTQGTTNEKDKDYIVRVSLSAEMDVELHKKVFLKFVESI